MGSADETERRIERLAAAVERYLALHPNASDTIEGIHQWWLVTPPFEEDVGLLKVALERLVDAGLMTKRALRNAQIVFSGTGLGSRPGGRVPPSSGDDGR